MKIIGNTVGTPLPKPNFKQTDPTKGDYIKNKPEVIDPAVGQLLAIKTIDEDGHIVEFESVEVSTGDTLSAAKSYTDNEIKEWVGDTTVSTQINNAISNIDYPVDSVNGKTGAVKLTAADVGALPNTTTIPSIAGLASETYVQEQIDAAVESIEGGTVANATHAIKADTATSATKATQDASGNVITATYETKSDASDKLDEAKSYTDESTTALSEGFSNVIYQMYGNDLTEEGAPTIRGIANDEANTALDSAKKYTDSEITEWVGDTKVPAQVSAALTSANSYTDGKIANLLDNSTEAIDSIYELRDAMEDNADAISALESIAGSKANVSDLTAHTGNKSNPHGVTLSQLGVTATAAELNIMDGVTATTTELNYVDGVTSNIQTQLNAKVPTTRKVNGKALSADITLSASDVGADAYGAANDALSSAKSYTDAEIKEWVGDTTVATQISTAIAAKADVKHTHTKSEITDFPASLKNPNALTIQGNGTTLTNGTYDGSAAKTVNITPASIGAAASSHGTHVSYSTTAPVMDGTASVGSASTVARSDHKHPTDTSRAAASEVTALKGLVGDTAVATQISNAVDAITPASIGAATSDHTHSGYASSSHTHSSYANQNAFSNVTVGSTTIAADTTTDTLTLVAGDNVIITPDATNDKITIAATDTVYTHPTTAGNKHIPSGGSSGQFLKWSSSGTATWAADNNTTYTFATGDSNGQIKVTPSGGSAQNVSVKGLGSVAYTNTVPITNGGTGATTAEEARSNLGFTYGSAEPEGTPSTGEGSVYFKTGGDVVVDEGTSGIWTYRKWASGIAECWGSYKYSGITCSSAWGGLYESSGQPLPDYPFAFAEVPHQTLEIRKTGTYAMMLRGPYSDGSVTTTKAGNVGFIRPSSTSTGKDVEVSIHVIGRWKV